MAYSYQNRDEPIYALATPLAESALAVIRTAGQGVIERIASCFSRPGALKGAPGHTAVVGAINDPADGSHVDQVVCVVYRAPKSYSGEEAVELSCHGSVATITACMRVLERAGLRQAEPGEFTLRAFLAGKMGLTQAEAVHEIVKARTDTARRLALGRLEGRLEARIEEIKQKLVGVLAAVQIQLDYPEEDTGVIAYQSEALNAAVAELEALVHTYGAGRLYQGGVRVALAGATNAGKSSLFNRLLAEDRSIVSETHGTTRDFIEASIEISGIPVQLFDTAGIREIQESVEREGIRRTREVISQAASVIYLVDATVGVTADDRAAMDEVSHDGTLIPVWNKTDLVGADGGGNTSGAGKSGSAGKSGGAGKSGAAGPGPAGAGNTSATDNPAAGPGPAGAGNTSATDNPAAGPGPVGGGDTTGKAPAGQGAGDSPHSISGSQAGVPPEGFIPISAERGEGLDALRARLHEVLTAGSAGLSGSETVIDNERQAGLVRRAIEAGGRTLESMHAGMPADIVAVDLQEAVDALGEITGEVSSDDVLDAMFSGFCVGK